MKLLKTLLLSLFLIVGLSNAQAQIKAGAGLAFGSEVEALGIELIGEYTINETWGAGVDFIYWLDGEDNFSYWEFNVNGHYNFFENEKFNAYALAGLNYFHFKIDLDLPPPYDGDDSDGEIGLNIGAGGHMVINENLTGRAQVRYVLSDWDQLVIDAGVLFNIN